MLSTGCASDFDLPSESTDLQHMEGSNQAKLKPIQLSSYSQVIGASLTEPSFTEFKVSKELKVSGHIEKDKELLEDYIWVKMNVENGSDMNETFEYYLPIIEGKFEQTLHFFKGAETYHVQLLAPSIERENYFHELTSFKVENIDEEMIRDIVYTPYGIAHDLILHEPDTGLIESEDMVVLSGEIAEAEEIMIQLQKDQHTWQHLMPVQDGVFYYEVPLYFGKGMHEVHLLLPDDVEEDRFQYSASLLVHNQSEQTMKPIEYHRGYHESGIMLESPRFGGTEVDLTLPIKGKINETLRPALTHIYIKTIKGTDEALDLIPINQGQFHDEILLRFGPGEYEVIINVPEPSLDNQNFFRFSSIAALEVVNIAEDQRDLLPSRGIQSQSPEIINLAAEIVKNKESDMEKAKAIYEYTAKNIEYDVEKYYHHHFEWDDSALKTLKTKKGVCQDYAYLAAALLRASNIEARFIAGEAGIGDEKENHAWIEAKIGEEWVAMDPTWGSGYIENGQFIAHYNENYFDPDETEFNKTHIRIGPEY